MLSQILTKAITLFFILDALGAVGMVVTIIRPFSPARQKAILRREMLISFLIMCFFYFFGGVLLEVLAITQPAVQITGGIIFLFFALSLLFPKYDDETEIKSQQEPFIVPIATPIIAGPSCLATIMLFSHEDNSGVLVTLPAIFLAWFGTALILMSSPIILRFMGKTGITVLERLMGLICVMLAVSMFVGGLQAFTQNLGL